jgi:hypothetical protein
LDKIVHCLLAVQIRKYVKAHTGVGLRLFRFAYGNIKPDLAPGMIIPFHKIDCSLNELGERVEELFSTDEGAISAKSFIVKLGVITHFISDYFCSAHSGFYKGKPVRHWLYETRMVFGMRKLFHFRRIMEGKLDTPEAMTADFKSFLQTMHDTYLRSQRSLLCDLAHSFAASTFFAMSAANLLKEKLLEQTQEPGFADLLADAPVS